MQKIHPTAIIGPKVELGQNVEIGPYSIIEGETKIGDNTVIMGHCYITGYTKIGKNNVFYPFSTIGFEPKDLKFKGDVSYVEIGDNNIFREYTNVCRATPAGGKTIIGSNNLFMTYVNIAHECIIGNNVILANLASLGGHVVVDDYARIGGVTAIHQFVRIGKYAMIGAFSKAVLDIPPYTIADGAPARVYGLNSVNLLRNNFSKESRQVIKRIFKLYYKSGGTKDERLALLEKEFGDSPECQEFVSFIKGTIKGIAHLSAQGKNEI